MPFLRQCTCFIVVMLPALAAAQTQLATLSGRLSAPGGAPVVGAEVVVSGSYPVISDSGGRFVVGGIGLGSTRLQVRALGFAPIDTVILVAAAQHEISLLMSQNAQVLAPVVTEAVLPYGKPLRYQHTGRFDEFYERRARRTGTFFTREDIESRGRSNVFELMSSVPGVIAGTRPGGIPYLRVSRCVGNSVKTGGEAYKWLALFINGQRIRGGSGPDVLEMLSQIKADDVETVEVYRGTTQLPMEAVGDACAAVFVTTRFTAGSVLPKR